ncbi:NADH:flavin oxidoreductase, partial [Sesbania bispinosa]
MPNIFVFPPLCAKIRYTFLPHRCVLVAPRTARSRRRSAELVPLDALIAMVFSPSKIFQCVFPHRFMALVPFQYVRPPWSRILCWRKQND